MHHHTRIKICGVTTPGDARMAADAGADAIGLNFYAKSPRYLNPQAAIPVMRALPPFSAAVGVFVNTPIRQATALAFQLGLRAIQTVDDVAQTEDSYPFAYIPAFRIADAAGVAAAVAFAHRHRPSAILVDAHVPGQMGGTGHIVPWHLLARVDFGVPLILAGGLTPANVAEAIRTVRPWGVDVASGVESAPGVKDPGKVRAFVDAVRSTASVADL